MNYNIWILFMFTIKKKIIKKMNPEKVYLQILCHETIFFLKKSFLSCY